jgi:hypothetical protein
MSNLGIAPSRRRVASVDWVAARKAFIERAERPTVTELAAEFGCTVERMNRANADEGWATLRAAHLDKQLRSGDAAVALMRAAQADTAVTHAVSNLALEVIQQLHEVVARAATVSKAENTRANTLNTVTFALKNLTGALKEVGIVGVPKSLKESAGVDSGNGRWNPAMLQSLNVTVQNLMQPGAVAASQVLATEAQPAPTAAILGDPAGRVGLDPSELVEADAVPVTADDVL